MREHKKLSKAAYNAKALNYENTFDGKFTSSFKANLLKEVKINKGDKVLDVACGTGIFLNQLLQLKHFEAYGIDIAENMIKVAKSRYPNINFGISDSEVLQFKDEFFNVITVCASFHHFPNPEKFISEASRLLSKDGHLYIAEVYLPPIIRQASNLLIPFSNSGDVKIYSTKEIFEMMKSCNFSDLKMTRKGLIQIICGKKY